MTDTSDNQWHLDKRVPLGIIWAIIFHTTTNEEWYATATSKERAKLSEFRI